jgi:hypothetical protein
MMKLFGILAVVPLVACAESRDDRHAGPANPAEDLALMVAALTDAPRTIPYGGYVDFDGEPVNASGVKFNFVLFPCATPGTGAGGCNALWVASGVWTNGVDWKQGWPTSAPGVNLPIFSGRFTVELGGAGQEELPDEVFEDEHEVLYLGIRIEGSALAHLQKVTPAFRSTASSQADRFRVRSAVEVDDPAGGSARISAADGLLVTHTNPTQERLFQVGSGLTPPLVVDSNGATISALAAESITAESVIAEDVEAARFQGPNAFPFSLRSQNDPFEDGSQIAFLRFDGTASDELGLLSGVTVGNPQYVPGRSGQGLQISSGNNFQSSNNVPITGAQARTLTVWTRMRLASQPDAVGIIGWGAVGTATNFFLTPSINAAHWGLYSSVTNVTSGRRPDLQWHFLTATYDGVIASLYIDGEFVGQNNIALTTTSSLLKTFSTSSTNATADAIVDSVRVFNRPLSPWEIKTLYFLGD